MSKYQMIMRNKIELLKETILKLATLLIKVSGTSMEPTYSDGDIVIIESINDIKKFFIGKSVCI